MVAIGAYGLGMDVAGQSAFVLHQIAMGTSKFIDLLRENLGLECVTGEVGARQLEGSAVSMSSLKSESWQLRVRGAARRVNPFLGLQGWSVVGRSRLPWRFAFRRSEN